MKRKIFYLEGSEVLLIRSPGDRIIAEVFIHSDGRDNEQCARDAKANGILMASSPDLLEALNRMVELHDMTMAGQSHGAEWQSETIKNARLAIAKAEGSK